MFWKVSTESLPSGVHATCENIILSNVWDLNFVRRGEHRPLARLANVGMRARPLAPGSSPDMALAWARPAAAASLPQKWVSAS